MIETVLIFLRNIQNSLNEYVAGVLLLRGGCPPSYEHTNNGIIEFCHSLSPPVHITTSAKCRSWFGTGSQEPTISAMSCGTSYTSCSSYMLLMRCRSVRPLGILSSETYRLIKMHRGAYGTSPGVHRRIGDCTVVARLPSAMSLRME